MFKKLLIATAILQCSFFANNLFAQASGCPEVVDQQQTISNSGSSGADQWQSFTAGATGSLTRIEIETNGCPSQSGTLTIYSGTGTAGTVIYSGSASISGCNTYAPMTIPLNSALVTSGSTYTFRIQMGGSVSDVVHTGNPYAGGYYYSSTYGVMTGWDLRFKTYITGTTYPTATATAGGATQFCAGGNVVINGNTGANLGWQWYNGSLISGATASSYTATASGSFTVKVTSTVTNCWNTSSAVTVTVNPVPVVTLTPASVSCNGGTNGSITSSVSSGTPAFSYSWAPAGGTVASPSGLTANNYTVTVTDSKSCVATQTTTVTQPLVLSSTGSQVNVACNSGSTGSASVTPSGGTTPYTYSWAPAGGTAANATSLSAGTYTCTITDNKGCVATRTVTITQPTALAASTGQTNLICNGISSGSATVTASGGVAAYTYAWSPSGGTSASASSLAAGNYTCTITDANACTLQKTFTITQPTALSATTGQTNVACFGGATGSATVTVSGGTGSKTYSWAPSGGTALSASGLTAASYTCTITDANGCTLPKTFAITQPSALAATTTQTNVACNGNSTATASVTVSGGVSGYIYSWSPSGGTAASASGLAAGAYTCTITDANGCTLPKTFTVTQPTALAATTSQTNILCNGNSTGSATVTASGGVSSYTYAWSPSGGTAASASGLAAGAYTCTITDANGCTLPKTFTITQPTALAAATSQTNILCNGNSSGSATVTASGGASGYTYMWSPSGGTSATASSLAAGNYTCTIIDANSCTLLKTFTLTQPTALAAATSQTNILCNGNSSGSATVTASGGASGYTYLWSPSGGTAATASSLAAGTYTCTITDANSCTLLKTFTLTQPSALAATTSQTNILCNGNSTGAASVSASGGAGGYSYLWSPSGGTAANATGLAAGNYTCTILDGNSCSINTTFTLTEPSALSAATSHTDVLCNGNSGGAASIIAAGGAGGYAYSWSPSGGNAATAAGLAAGTYTCTITDANACTLANTFTITQPSALSSASSQTDVSCNNGSNGVASVSVSGGTGSYSYSWTPGSSVTSSATGLNAGSYACLITDANGCTLTENFTITQPTAVSAAATQTDVSCNGGSDGSASVSGNGGTGSYSYLWNPGGEITSTINGLPAGNYFCTITDANGCLVSNSFTITQPTALTAASSQSNVLCNGGSTGSASVTVSGGTPAYTYSWTPSGGTGSTASNLTAGAYTCTTTDANGCFTLNSFTITELSVVTVSSSQSNVSCNGGSNASATVTGAGGTASFTYLWTPGGATTSAISSLAAGTYSCVATDGNGCSASTLVTITEPSQLTSTASQTNVTCNGGSNGSATVNASGGTAAYSYSWAPSGGTGMTASGLVAGNYTCTTTDANGCSVTNTFTLTQPTAITATTSQTNILCNGGNNGSAAVSATGGTGAYSYAWSPFGGTSALASSLTAGNYTCTITDANSCSITRSFTITAPAALSTSLSSSNISCYGGTNGSAAVSANGGTSPYTYAWSPNTSSSFAIFNIAAGNYSCTVTDANGCSAIQVANITQPAQIVISMSTNPTVCGANYGSAAATVTGGTSPYVYQWSSGSTSSVADSLTAGQYLLQVYDAMNCSSSAVANINTSNGPAISSTSANVSCFGGNDGAIAINVSGGTAPFTYDWSNGASTASLSGLSAGPYDVTVSDVFGCSAVQTINITQPAALLIAFSVTNATCGASDGNISAVVTGGTGAYTYLWSANSGAQTGAVASALAAGIYSVTVTDASSCSNSASTAVNSQNSTLAVSIAGIVPGDCGTLPNGSVTTSVTGGTGSISYLWSDNSTQQDLIGVVPGTYFVTVMDGNNCSASASAIVPSSVAGYQPEICLVTVDTNTMTNLVVWEKTLYGGISNFKVYRETTTPNVYMNIGTVAFDSLSQFTDPTANPQTRSWRYKISAVDSCNIETPKSSGHKTIHLTQNAGLGGVVNLAWDYYDGFAYNTFFIWRHDPSTGWMKIDSLPNTLTTYTDLAPPSAAARYMIEVIPTTPCDPSRAVINTSRSNIKTQQAVSTDAAQVAANTALFGAYPNPTNDQVTVHVQQNKTERMTIKLYDTQGKLVYAKSFEASSINENISLKAFANGMYLLELRSETNLKQLKLIKND
jgi:large repetitive protein